MTPAPGRCQAVVAILLLLVTGCGRSDRGQGHSGLSGDAAPPSAPVAGKVQDGAESEAFTTDLALDRSAYELRDLEHGRVLSSNRETQLDAAIQPGSIAKIVTLAAALDAGVVQPGTTVMCQRTIRIGSRVLDCAHPVLPAPPAAVEALAQSCNSYFTFIGSRLTLGDLSRMGVALGIGRYDETASPTLAAIGLDGIVVAPRKLPGVIVRLAAGGMGGIPTEATRRVTLEALAAASLTGTAAPLGTVANDVLAKTGTTTAANDQPLGLVVAAWPASRPVRSLVVVAPGGSGRDAAAVGAEVIRRASARTASDDIEVAVGRLAGDTLRVDRVPLVDYVAEVVAAEAPPEASPVLLEAMAIAARTFALSHPGRHGVEGYDLCDLTHCQAMARATVSSETAERSTRRLVLTWQHRLAPVFYSASCGGRLAAASTVWPDDAWPPYLSSRADPAAHETAPWTSEVDEPSLVRALRGSGFRGATLRTVRIVRRSADGRAERVSVDGLVPDETRAEAFRLAVGRGLGWQVLKSTWFDVERTATGYRFRGRGQGHGVGLCVLGAASLARAGRSLEDILQAYFPGTEVESINALRPQSNRESTGRGMQTSPSAASLANVRLIVPSRNEGARQRVMRVVGHALDEIGHASGQSPRSTVTVRIHPTAESYRRATGLPWWTRGATRDRTIDLIPLETLDERHELDETVRHELAHALTADVFGGRPRWVKEGAAAYFARGRSAAFDPKRPSYPQAGDSPACPSDDEFTTAASAGELQRIYARADRCFRQAIAAGTAWYDVR